MDSLKKDSANLPMKDIRQDQAYAFYLSKLGWRIKKQKNVYYFICRILPFLQIIKVQRPETLDTSFLKKIILEEKITITIVEPKDERQAAILKKLNFRQTKPYLPSKTLVIDLSQKLETILKKTKKDCRLSIKKTKNIKIKKCQRKDLAEFYSLWKKSVGLKRYVPPFSQIKNLSQIFRENTLFLLYKDSQGAASGAIFLKNKWNAYYWQAFTNKKAREKLIQYQIVWQGVLWAKKNKCLNFDFEGVFDPRFPDKKWLGFSHFKKSFGGEEITYPGAFLKIDLNFW
jgi:lipid II:glycine glycyltransferase (peptidoglycan interpeptide bridge formation enzyme)